MRRAQAPVVIRILVAVLLGSLSWAHAAPADDLTARVEVLSRERAALATRRDAQAAAYGKQIREIADLKARASSWARDRRLQAALSSARDGATALEARERELRAKDQTLATARREALAAVDAELATQPEEPRRSELAARRQRLAPAARPIRIPDERIDPLDDPEDLEQKASALAEVEQKLLAERTRLAHRVDAWRKQARLTRAKQRAEAPDLLADDGPRRTPAPRGRGGDAFEEPADSEDSPTPTGPPTGGGAVESPADPAIVLADVVDPSALAELRRAESSGDAEARALAAESAKKSLEARLAKLRARRLEMEQRAKALRAP
jgi:hypothetical protein